MTAALAQSYIRRGMTTQQVLQIKPKKPPIALIQAVMNLGNAVQRLGLQLIPPQAAMLQMINSYRVSQSICVAAKLGIADLLKDGAKNTDELAKATGTHAPSLYRLLRALASIGVFAETNNGCFELTPLAATLQSNVPNSTKAAAILFGDKWHWQLWENLLESVKTGKTALELVFDAANPFEYFVDNPEAGYIFDEAMTSNSATADRAIACGYDFSQFQTLVDIGGGQGSLLATIVQQHPSLNGVLFDQAAAIAGAKQKQYFKTELAQRCQLVVGDFFEAVPVGGDAYILKTVIHDWNDEAAIAILKNCHRAMVKHGKLLLVELVIPPKNTPSFAKFLDLEMLVMMGGRERTEAEYQILLKAAGFQLTKIIFTASPWSIIEAVSA